jgi:hypothetical protein
MSQQEISDIRMGLGSKAQFHAKGYLILFRVHMSRSSSLSIDGPRVMPGILSDVISRNMKL